MILAIVPLPNRIIPGSMINGMKLDSHYIQYTNEHVMLQRGRNFLVPPSLDVTNALEKEPIYFFKVISVWGEIVYEHVFMSWHKLHPYYLTNNGHPVELTPVSVKRCGIGGTGSYLFVETINNFFKSFEYSSYWRFRGFEYEWDRVVSFPTYLTECIKPITHMFNTEAAALWAKNEMSLALATRLTPVVPVQVDGLYNDIIQYIGMPDQLYAYLDDSYHYETGEHFSPAILSDQYEYGWTTVVDINGCKVTVPDIDPITMLCLNSPTTITSLRLLPFIGNQQTMDGYFQLAHATMINPPPHMGSILDSEFAANTTDYNGLDQLVEAMCAMPASDVVVYIENRDSKYVDDDWVKVEENHMFTPFIDPIYSRQDDIKIAGVNIAEEYRNTNVTWDSITITKTWMDEIFMTTVIDGGERYGSHVTLPLYHLASTSLINGQLIDAFLNSM